ncbi:MAG TPA: hypothetical protein VKB33_07390 [Nitrospira sp.]|nr:hypothetical protein [Nitrospira sp.]
MVGLSFINCLCVEAAEPTFELTARYILEVVKAFRTACVLEAVEQARDSGIRPNEEWQTDSHFIPLPAQFVKAAGDQLDNFEVDLIGLTPVTDLLVPWKNSRPLRLHHPRSVIFSHSFSFAFVLGLDALPYRGVG